MKKRKIIIKLKLLNFKIIYTSLIMRVKTRNFNDF